METSLAEQIPLLVKGFCSQNDLFPIIKTLSLQFYFKLSDMKNMTIDQWRRFALPENLYFLLQESYHRELSKLSYVQVREVTYEMLGKSNVNNDNDSKENPPLILEHQEENKLPIQSISNNKTTTEITASVVSEVVINRPIMSNHRPSHCDFSHSEIAPNNNITNIIDDNTNTIVKKNSNENITSSIMSDPLPEGSNQRNKIRSRTAMGAKAGSEIDINKVNNFISQIATPVKVKEDAKSLLNLLLTIFSNLKTGEERYRKINIRKIYHTYPYVAIEALFYYCSFIKLDSTYMKYQKEIDIQMINTVSFALNNYIKAHLDEGNTSTMVQSTISNQSGQLEKEKEKEIQLSTITSLPSPSSSILSLTTDNNSTLIIPEKKKSIAELIEEEKVYRVKKLINYDSPIIRNPKLILVTSIEIQQSFIKQFDQSNNIIKPTEEDKKHIEDISLLIAMDQSIENTLQRGELATLLEQPLIITADFFFIFRDNYMLHGTFCIKEKIQTLYDFISNHLHDPKTQFHLVKEGRTYPDKSDLIKDQTDMVFGKPIIINVFFQDSYSKLKEQSVKKLLIDSKSL